MARYTGTRGRDEFYGISGQDNRFLFRPGYLDGADIVSGSTALTDIDTLVLYRPDGATGSVRAQAGKFDQVRNIEVVELADPGIVLTVSQQLAGSSQRGFLTINGSSGNDVVSGQPTDPSRGPVTTALVFNANGGADSFTGGEGDDRVRFADETRTGTTLDGRGGFDTLVYTGVGTFDFATLADVRQFEGVELRASDGSATLILDNKPFATSDSGAFTVRSYGSDTIDASRVSAGNTVIARSLTDGATLDVALGGGDDRFEGVFAKGQLNGGAGDDVLDLDFSGSPVFVSGGLYGFYRYVNGVSESLQVTGFERLVVRAPDQGGSFSGGNGDDIFIGGAGYDSFNVGWGFDSVDGGTGNDGLGLDFNAAASGVTIARSSSGPDFTYSATSGGQILASGQATSIERLSIYDSRFDDVLNGGDGDDYFSLTRGHDIVSGGAGFDQVFYSFNSNGNGVNFTTLATGAEEFTAVATSGDAIVSSAILTSIESIIIVSSDYDDVIHLFKTGIVSANAGDDLVYISTFPQLSLGGGIGDDTLALDGAGIVINLLSGSTPYSFERYDLTGSGDNSLTLNDLNVINVTDTRDSAFTAAPIDDALVVLGDAGDVLDLRASSPSGSWTEVQSGVGLDGAAGGGFDFWAYTAYGTVTAFLAVDSDVTIVRAQARVVTTAGDELAETSDIVIESADGQGLSLREALSAEAETGQIVRFDASLTGQSLQLTDGPLSVTAAPFTVLGDINGDGASDITVTADGANPAFVVNGGDLTLSNLSIETAQSTPSVSLAGLGGRLSIAGTGAETVDARSLTDGATLDVALGGGDDRFTGVFAKGGRLDGGAGDDVLDLDFSGSPVFVSGGLYGFYRYVNGVSESLQVTGFERLIVRAPDQGGSFSGGNGDDIFIGGAGYDYFDPGRGFDSVDGGAGNDTLGLNFFDAASGVTVARSSSGPDFTYTATSGGQTLASGQATSIESLNINDSRFDDVLNGGDGDEYFSLTRGHDVVSGGAGYDSAYISFIGTTTGVDFVAQTSGINALTYTATSGGGVIASGALTSIERLSVDGSNYNDIIRLPVTGSVYAGAGDDIVYISSINNVFLSGGLGDDTLALEGSGLEIDLTPRIFAAYSIERLDLTGSGDNNLILNDQNVIDATDNRDSAFTAAPINDALVVLGDAGDVLDLRTSSPGGAWAEVQSGVGLDGAAGGGFDFWAYTADGAVTAFLAVDSDVTVTTDGNAAADAFVSALQAQEAAKDDAPLELTQDLLLPAFFDVDEPVAPYSPLHGDFAQPHIA